MKTYEEMLGYACYSYEHDRQEREGDEAYPKNVWAMADMIAFMFDLELEDVADEIIDGVDED